jgi:hypothetical protein
MFSVIALQRNKHEIISLTGCTQEEYVKINSPLCFPSLNCAFFDDLKVSKNSIPFCSSSFRLALSHLCSEAKISIIRGNALPAASVSRKASRHLLATKSTADSQYS